MSQTYTDDCFASGHAGLTDLQNMENNFAALKSAFSGVSAPPNPVGGMWWLDTTTHILKLRNEANDAWLSFWDMAGNKPIIANIISSDFAEAMKDAAAAVASLRTLGTGANQAMPGNTSQLAPLNGSVTAAKFENAVAGDILLIASAASVSQENGSYTKKKEIYIPRTGTYRIKFTLNGNTGPVHGHGRIYRNGVAVGTERSTQSASGVEFSEDIAGWSPGDLCQLYLYHHVNGTASAINFRIYAATCLDFLDLSSLLAP